MTIPKSNGDTPVKKSASSGNHIMISYNSASKDVCVQIKDELKVRPPLLHNTPSLGR